MTFLWFVFILSIPGMVEANEFVNESRTITGPPESTTERFNFVLGQDDPYPHFELTIEMSQGRADLQIFDPAGRRLQSLGAQSVTLPLQPFLDATTPGTYRLELVTTEALGQWHLRVCGGPKLARLSIWPDLTAALGMILVAGASPTGRFSRNNLRAHRCSATAIRAMSRSPHEERRTSSSRPSSREQIASVLAD